MAGQSWRPEKSKKWILIVKKLEKETVQIIQASIWKRANVERDTNVGDWKRKIMDGIERLNFITK